MTRCSSEMLSPPPASSCSGLASPASREASVRGILGRGTTLRGIIGALACFGSAASASMALVACADDGGGAPSGAANERDRPGKADGLVVERIAFGDTNIGVVGRNGGTRQSGVAWTFDAKPGARFEIRIDSIEDPATPDGGAFVALYGARKADAAGHLNAGAETLTNPGTRYEIAPFAEPKVLGTYDASDRYSLTLVHTATYGSAPGPFEIDFGWGRDDVHSRDLQYSITLTCLSPDGCVLPEAAACHQTTEAALAVYDQTWASDLSFYYFNGQQDCVRRAGTCTAPFCKTMVFDTLEACAKTCMGTAPLTCAGECQSEGAVGTLFSGAQCYCDAGCETNGDCCGLGRPDENAAARHAACTPVATVPPNLCDHPSCGVGGATCAQGQLCVMAQGCTTTVCATFAEACADAGCALDKCGTHDISPTAAYCTDP